MYSREELAFQKAHAFATLIRNGITTALPIASLFYRAWGETPQEFEDAAEAAARLGLRVYLGPGYRTGNQVVEEDGTIATVTTNRAGSPSSTARSASASASKARAGGLIRTMLAPDRIETCTPELLRRTGAAARALDVPLRQHCCQSKIEYDLVLKQHGMSPPEWLESLGVFTDKTLLPHGTYVSGSRHIERPGRDLEILRDHGATIVHCPLVSGRHGNAIDHFGRYRDMGLRIGMGTDTSPPDMILNLQVGIILRPRHGGQRRSRALRRLLRRSDDPRSRRHRPAGSRPAAAGGRADITIIDLDRPHSGQVIDPIQTLLLTGHGRDVSTVVIDGCFVMEDRNHPRRRRGGGQPARPAPVRRADGALSRAHPWASSDRRDLLRELSRGTGASGMSMAAPSRPEPLLGIDRLKVVFDGRHGSVTALDEVSFDIAAGEILGVVGESGAGKSLTGTAVIGLLDPPGRISGGAITLGGRRLDRMTPEELRKVRGRARDRRGCSRIR